MELIDAKYISIIVLFLANLILILFALCLHRYVIKSHGNGFILIQRIISCLTSGILLGTFLILVLPTSLNLISHQWDDYNYGYLFIALGFFFICLIKESIKVHEQYSLNISYKPENEQLINSLNQDNQTTRLITLVFALCVHFFFSGFLIGGQTDITTLWILLGVICLHMCLIAFSVTLRLLIDKEKPLRVLIAMCIWSIMGPLGVLTSLLISSNTSEFNLANGILQCISAGIFLYITFIDMIHDDLMQRISYPFLNIILIFIGFVIIVLTSFFHKHSH